MNLCVDIGNTLAKWGLFEGDELAGNGTAQPDELDGILAAILRQHPAVNRAIFSINGADYRPLLPERIAVMLLDEHTPLPIENRYRTPETLGCDRLAAAVAAHARFPGRPVLVVDCGTCVTYDFVNPSHEYLGGGISPGLSMRLKALHMFTERLPLVERTEKAELIGASTAASIQSGIVNGMTEEIKGMIQRYMQQAPSLKVLLTGGDAGLFAKALENEIFADPHLVLRGLNVILNHNAPAL